MIIYSVMVIIKQEIENSWLNWMKTEHIKDVLATGYFNDYTIQKQVIPEGFQNEVTYLINYTRNDLESYQEYAKNEASRMQQKHTEKFSGKFRASRAVYEIIN